MRHLGRLRSNLEAFAVEVWRGNGTRKLVEGKLRNQLPELRRMAQTANFPGFFARDHLLHRAIVEAADISTLLQSWELVVADMNDWIKTVQCEVWPSLMALYQEHLYLLDAITGNSDPDAREACHQHIEGGWHRVAAFEKNVGFASDTVDRAIAFIYTYHASKIALPWIAQEVGHTSYSHFNRLFRKRTGSSPASFLKQVRLERAAQLLKTDAAAVAAIASSVGYCNTSHFVKDFRTLYGTTPHAFRSFKADRL